MVSAFKNIVIRAREGGRLERRSIVEVGAGVAWEESLSLSKSVGQIYRDRGKNSCMTHPGHSLLL